MPTVNPSIKNSPSWRRDVGNLSMVSVTWSVGLTETVDISEVEPYDLLELPAGWEIQFIEMLKADPATGSLDIDLGIKDGDTDLFFDGQAIDGTAGITDSRDQTRHKPYKVDTLNQRLTMTLVASGNTDIPNNDSVELVFFVYFVDRGPK